LVPPVNSISPLAIFVGKNPGAMAVVRIFWGPSSTARPLARCSAAALEAL